jgi:hypothetical protein
VQVEKAHCTKDFPAPLRSRVRHLFKSLRKLYRCVDDTADARTSSASWSGCRPTPPMFLMSPISHHPIMLPAVIPAGRPAEPGTRARNHDHEVGSRFVLVERRKIILQHHRRESRDRLDGPSLPRSIRTPPIASSRLISFTSRRSGGESETALSDRGQVPALCELPQPLLWRSAKSPFP